MRPEKSPDGPSPLVGEPGLPESLSEGPYWYHHSLLATRRCHLPLALPRHTACLLGALQGSEDSLLLFHHFISTSVVGLDIFYISF